MIPAPHEDSLSETLGGLIAATSSERPVLLAAVRKKNPDLAAKCERVLRAHDAADKTGFMSHPASTLPLAPQPEISAFKHEQSATLLPSALGAKRKTNPRDEQRS